MLVNYFFLFLYSYTLYTSYCFYIKVTYFKQSSSMCYKVHFLDPAWQEMLNHATQRVNEAERDRGVAETEHRIACVKHEAASAKVQSLQKELKRAITKSR